MKIGVLSDTHIEDLGFGINFLSELVCGPLAGVDVVLHAGDIVHPDLLDCFEQKPVLAVRGNCDLDSPGLPTKRIFEAAGFRIGLIHGWGNPVAVANHVLTEFSTEQLDALIFGHSHYPLCRRLDDMLLFNPGSALDRRGAPFHSVGILTLGDRVDGQILNLDTGFNANPDLQGVLL
ncbi:MAG: hypothetical protein C0623_12310 [Desulfuromonas sp.]|nr:MAG: hypothetical protein C0623_12310 [Desulfuromonas sp.]